MQLPEGKLTILDDAGWYGLCGRYCWTDEDNQVWIDCPAGWEPLEVALANQKRQEAEAKKEDK